MQLASQDSALRSPNWSLIIILAALVGVIAGYIYTLIAKPQLLPARLEIRRTARANDGAGLRHRRCLFRAWAQSES